jgi:hypothetical protein
VEIIIAVVIIAIAAAALLGALITTISSSVEHRSLAKLDTVLKSNAETLKYEIELQQTPWFTSCAAVTSSSYAAYPVSFSEPSVSFAGISYWNGSAFVTSCNGNDNGLQLLTLTASTNGGVSQSLQFVVRHPT